MDDWVLDDVVQSEVGPVGQLWRLDRVEDSPINVVLETIDRSIELPYVVYGLRGGLPAPFSRPSFNPAVAVFNVRFVEIMTTLEGAFSQSIFSPAVLEEVAHQICLQVMAELTLKEGDPSLACHLLATSFTLPFTSQQTKFPIQFMPTPIVDIEFNYPKDEAYMSAMYFALLHEMGHIADAYGGTPEETAEFVRDELDRRVPQILANLPGAGAPWMLDLWQQGTVPAELIDRDTLAEEVHADMFAVFTIFQATRDVMAVAASKEGRSEVEFRDFDLGVWLMLAWMLYRYLNGSASAARGLSLQYMTAVGAWESVASTVRFEFMLHAIASQLSATYAPSFNETHENLLKAWEQLLPRREAFRRGYEKALAELQYARRRAEGSFMRLARQVQDGSAIVVLRPQLLEFLVAADELGVSHPDLDLLVAIAGAPDRAVSAVGASKRAFFAPWLIGPHADVPFGYTAHGDTSYYAFAFTKLDSANRFWEARQGDIDPGYRLALKSIEVATEQDAAIAISSEAPPAYLDVKVAVEGSDSFVRLMKRLDDPGFRV